MLVSYPTRLSSSSWWRPQIAEFEKRGIWEKQNLRIVEFEKCRIWEMQNLSYAEFEKCRIWESQNLRNLMMKKKVNSTISKQWLVKQSGRKCGVGSQRTCSHFFRLLAHILTFFDKNTVFWCVATKESLIQLFCNKIVFRYAKNVRLASFSASMALCDCHYGSLWL